MKNKLLNTITAVILFLIPNINFGQAVITSEPTDQTVCFGTSASFSVAATGSGLTYQWRKGILILVDGGSISGANTATLTINPAFTSDASSDYNVIVTGGFVNDTSQNAILIVETAPDITTQPTNQLACVGQSASFSVAATGLSLTYRWRRGNVDLVSGGNIIDATAPTLSINPVTATDFGCDYNVVVSGGCFPPETSVFVCLGPDNPIIITEPTSQTVCAGSSASFSVSATGTGLAYQWFMGNTSLVNGGNISGANSATLTINPVNAADTASNYHVVVTGACSPNDTSINVSLRLNSQSIITQPSNQTVCAGTAASFSVSATGTGLTYQWYQGSDSLINGGYLSGANSPILTINPVLATDTASNYYVTISGACPTDTSINVFLRWADPKIITQPTSQAVCLGGSASFSVATTGANLTYQWYLGSVGLTNGGNISGANTPTLTINPVSLTDASIYYYVVVSSTVCSSKLPSDFVSLNVGGSLIITEPTSQSACAGSPASFSVSAIGAGLTYQWRKGTVNLVNGGNISGANSSILTINSVGVADLASNYNVVVSSTVCAPNDTSINVSLFIGGALILTEPTSQAACAGSPASFSVTATGTGLVYQWRKGTVNLVNGGNISGANSAILTINPVSLADVASNYNVVVSSTVCAPNDTSINVSLIIGGALIITEPSSQAVCAGSSASFSVAASGTALSYQWYLGTVSLNNGGNISGANTPTLTINPVSATNTATNYNVVVSSGKCAPSKTSINVSLIIGGALIVTEPTSQSACDGSPASLSVAATGTGLTYQWRKGTVNLVNGPNISGVNSATLTFSAITATDVASNYNVVVSSTACGGTSDVSVNVSLNIGGAVITAEPADQTTCLGSSASFVVAATGTGLNYQWRKGTVNLVNGGNIFGVNTATLTFNPVSATDLATNYNVVVSSAVCSPTSVTSINVSLLIAPTPVAIANNNSPVCIGGTIIFTSLPIKGATYYWSGPNGYSSTAQNPAIPSASLANAGNYTLTVTSGCSSATAITAVVIASDCTADLSVVKTVNNTTPLVGKNVVFTIIATNNGPSDAPGVVVNDILQSGYAYVASSATIGNYNPSAGVWTIGNLNNGASAELTVTVTVIANGNYVNTATVTSGNIDLNTGNNVSSIETFPVDFFIPEGFSPNGDGINDDFVIRGISYFPDNKFEVFNRWGDKVFDAYPYKNTWDGKATRGIRIGGDDLPVGTYFYTLDLGDGSKVYKGTIYLNR